MVSMRPGFVGSVMSGFVVSVRSGFVVSVQSGFVSSVMSVSNQRTAAEFHTEEGREWRLPSLLFEDE